MKFVLPIKSFDEAVTEAVKDLSDMARYAGADADRVAAAKVIVENFAVLDTDGITRVFEWEEVEED